MCLIVLIRATISRDLTTVTGDREFFGLTVTVAVVMTIAIIGIKVMDAFPALGFPVMDRVRDTASAAYLADANSKAGAENAVAAVMLNFRLYDTLGQIAVLFFAVLGAMAILRRKARKGSEEKDGESDAV